MDELPHFGVPVAPNQSIVRGTVLAVAPGPDGMGVTSDVEVRESQDVEDFPNFTRAYTGKPITILVHPDFKSTFAVGNVIEAVVHFQGDERGGAFFLVDDKLRRIE